MFVPYVFIAIRLIGAKLSVPQQLPKVSEVLRFFLSVALQHLPGTTLTLSYFDYTIQKLIIGAAFVAQYSITYLHIDFLLFNLYMAYLTIINENKLAAS